MKAFVEGYGCSLNLGDTEQVRGFLQQNGFRLVKEPEKAELLVINTCAVKEQTETKMLRRIRELNKAAEKRKATLVVFGCLPKINASAIMAISKGIVQIGPSLEKLASFLRLPLQEFSPALEEKKASKVVSIIAVARGCLGNCAYCAAKNARGSLHSYPVQVLEKKFRKAIMKTPEIWLTAQDCGCYGFDNGKSLAGLLKELLKNKGDFRIRVGMINPGHLAKFLPEYLSLFRDRRLYRFFHLPVQSGSNEILRKMNRPYKREDFLRIVKEIRKRFPDASIATDVIAGFPGETESQFNESLSLVKEAMPDVVNISRFGARPGTLAAAMPGQLHGREKKKRSRQLTVICKEIALDRNRLFEGTVQELLFDEKGPKGGIVGRAGNYKPVVLKKGKMGCFATVKITKAFSTHLLGAMQEKLFFQKGFMKSLLLWRCHIRNSIQRSRNKLLR